MSDGSARYCVQCHRGDRQVEMLRWNSVCVECRDKNVAEFRAKFDYHPTTYHMRYIEPKMTCDYCGRTGTRGFTHTIRGVYACSNRNACQLRQRKT